MDHFTQLATHCVAGDGSGAFALAGVLFLSGLVGGAAHCGPMCGPFVLAQTAGATPGPLLGRLRGVALLPFHLGRLATYTALGMLAGSLGASLFQLARLRYAFALFLALAAALFLLHGLRTVAPSLFPPARHALGRRVAALVVGRAAFLLRTPEHARGFALGALLGFLPCGFLYGALAASAASGDALRGGTAMAAFALGTAPSLVAVGLVGAAAARHWTRASARLLGPVFLLNAALLGAMAVRSAAAAL
jgi:sulfite exporter TauE/SafE